MEDEKLLCENDMKYDGRQYSCPDRESQPSTNTTLSDTTTDQSSVILGTYIDRILCPLGITGQNRARSKRWLVEQSS